MRWNDEDSNDDSCSSDMMIDGPDADTGDNDNVNGDDAGDDTGGTNGSNDIPNDDDTGDEDDTSGVGNDTGDDTGDEDDENDDTNFELPIRTRLLLSLSWPSNKEVQSMTST